MEEIPSKKQKNPGITSEQIKLWDIAKGSKIYCECGDDSEYIIFDHLDGMYSYCETEKGAVVHLGGGQPLEVYKDGYKLAGESTLPE